PATTVNWGVWSGAGAAGDAYHGVLDPIQPAQGIEALETVLSADRPATGVIRLDPAGVAAAFPDVADLAFFAPVLGHAGTADEAATADGWSGPSALRALPAAA